MSEVHQSRRHQRAVLELKARGERQSCFSCGRALLASARKGDPRLITLGHYSDVDSGRVADPYHPSAYGPQCSTCNYGGGARRTNAKRSGRRIDELRTSPDWR